MLCYTLHTIAQVKPADNSKLNYRLIGFSIPPNEHTTSYRFEIADGTYYNSDSFRHNIIESFTDSNHRIIETIPAFGKKYTWRVVFLNQKGKAKDHTPFYHFETLMSPYVDTTQYKLRIIDSAQNHPERLVFIDHSAVLYDMKGNPLWYLPDTPGNFDRNMPNRDLKVTPTGTITIINEKGAFEFNYDGHLVWHAPNDGRVSGDSMEHYHHEFTKLSNGHYMVCGVEHVVRKLPADVDTCAFTDDMNLQKIKGIFYKKMDCGTLIEYDSSGNIAWSLKTSQYFSDDDFFMRPNKSPFYLTDPHMNSFDFDEKNKVIYIGYRNLSCILKIEYPSGKLLAAYGKTMHPEKARKAGVMYSKVFNAQHCVRLSKEGSIYLFNNNSDHFINEKRELNPTSTIQMFKEPTEATEGLTKLWEFSCDIDTFAAPGSGTGGSVQMLDNKNILVGMGLAGRTFIVNPEKHITWNAVCYYRPILNGKWDIMPMYRVYGIENKKDLYELIFND